MKSEKTGQSSSWHLWHVYMTGHMYIYAHMYIQHMWRTHTNKKKPHNPIEKQYCTYVYLNKHFTKETQWLVQKSNTCKLKS